MNGTAPTTYSAPYVQLHIGDPGAAGTTNIASNSTREQATGTWTITSGSTTNPAAVTWTSVPATETYTYFSLWSAATLGTFLGSGTITGGAVTAGNTFQAAIGALTISNPLAS